VEFLVLLGPPGSGKGTLSRLLQETDGWTPISTGELIRKRMSDPESDFGKAAKPFMDRGDYIPNALALSLFFSLPEITSPNARLILDGFPRTSVQAEVFHTWCRLENHHFVGCGYIQVPEDVAVARMQQRRICSECRKPFHLEFRPSEVAGVCDDCGGALMPREDDDPVRLKQRMYRHEEQTRPLKAWFAEREKVAELDGRKDPTHLRNELYGALLPNPG
jgi:adenylate kinase